ncbi:uncharacterized protein TM35_000182060 [Trypanosoma theileri]|uniref:Uncharacterized protein n=1 Tax=Trypanosoma theileri TaxID=67003 RepID=A0A1X0NVC2_9TRYP|nr:uncharacterized protein TM35_000182060 [Trypanosoma theileri]ORC88149.1 hypothetical protein TM35_000182060 [Trypanosoma theileri]
MHSVSTQESSEPNVPSVVNADDVMSDEATRSYIAMAVPLLHVLQQQNTSQAAAVARQIVERWGLKAGPAVELVKLLETMESERGNEEEEEEEDEDDDNNDNDEEEEEEDGSSTDDEEEEEEEENSSGGGGKESANGGNVLETLRQIIEQLPPAAKGREGTSTSMLTTTTTVKDIGDLENETDEEKRIFDGIAGAVEREMKRLAVVRKHR